MSVKGLRLGLGIGLVRFSHFSVFVDMGNVCPGEEFPAGNVLRTHQREMGTKRDAVVASAHRLPVFSTSAHRDVLLSAIGRLLLPALT